VKAFTYARATTAAEGVAAAASGARLLAGGTDLLPLMKARLLSPDHVVDISRLGEGWDAVAEAPDGGLRIGACCTLAQVAAQPRIRAEYAALAEAAASAGSPQIRNTATLGGNLCQWNRCWYFRGGIPCHLSGGDGCPAAQGDNRHHAIFRDGPCVAVHPSDPAVALLALGADVELVGPSGPRRLPLAEFLRAPRPGDPDPTQRLPGEVVAAVTLPPACASRSAYHKAMDRQAWAFALVSAAVVLQVSGGVVTEAAVVLGGVAPLPYRAAAAEDYLRGRRLTAPVAAEAAAAGLEAAQPLAGNGYKVALAAAVFVAALLACCPEVA